MFTTIKIKAINTETGESFDYDDSLYKAGRDLMINHGRICDILNGLQKSKKYSQRFIFEKI